MKQQSKIEWSFHFIIAADVKLNICGNRSDTVCLVKMINSFFVLTKFVLFKAITRINFSQKLP